MAKMDARQAKGMTWDVIVVGTGIGGATAGYALARAGKRVLFCERGLASPRGGAGLRGAYPESSFPDAKAPDLEHRPILAKAGRCSDLFEDRSHRRGRHFIPLLGAGAGGSSALYGMAMERFFPADFEPLAHHDRRTGTTLPEHWPVSFEEMLPYYAAAERLYRVRGARDPLRSKNDKGALEGAPPLTLAAQEVFSFLQQRGCHPYRLPLACDFVPGCECCQGFLCSRECKIDSARACLYPAVADHDAELIEECEVLRLEATRSQVTGVVVRDLSGDESVLRGSTVILAAGAAETPSILLRSASSEWPAGLANDSGMVGRNLMRHQVDLYLLVPRVDAPFDNRQKEIAFNDLYFADGMKLGTVQSFGALPPSQILAAKAQKDIGDIAGPAVQALVAPFRGLIAKGLGRLLERGIMLAGILEDLPYADNRIVPGSEGGANGTPRYVMNYSTPSIDRLRLAAFRNHIASILRGRRYVALKQAENNQILGHICGTCRFGTDPTNSVANADCRAHSLQNLYIVDSSFLPSSAGTNPALTIAANALRVTDRIAGSTSNASAGPLESSPAGNLDVTGEVR